MIVGGYAGYGFDRAVYVTYNTDTVMTTARTDWRSSTKAARKKYNI